ADRGFADQALYPAAQAMRLEYVVRFRQDTIVTDTFGKSKPAREWVPTNGRPKRVEGPAITAKATQVPVIVCVKKAKMKESWCLVSSRADLTAAEIVELYGKRFTTEENFRDTKDIRFGLGLSATHIGVPARRDRLLLLCALAQALLTLLGAACERTGLDRRLKANTSKKRTHSLFRQGLFWFSAIPTMRDDWFEPLMVAFEEILRERTKFTGIFATI
ncbi:MAG: transposase, partial [Phycisphaerae bacterium]|nr:transposase [Phycisphaerae bacterium]